VQATSAVLPAWMYMTQQDDQDPVLWVTSQRDGAGHCFSSAPTVLWNHEVTAGSDLQQHLVEEGLHQVHGLGGDGGVAVDPLPEKARPLVAPILQRITMFEMTLKDIKGVATGPD